MNVYLAKFVRNNKVAFKVGHTKYYYAYKRFDDPQYNVFDSVDILCEIHLNHKDPTVARTYAKLVEETLKAVYPKNFRLEEHFNTENNMFNGLSGITEMFVLNDNQKEEDLLKVFNRTKNNVERIFYGQST